MLVFSSIQAQNLKIGYTNVEYILTFMPETKQMESTLKTHSSKWEQQLGIKQAFLEQKMQEYLQGVEQKKFTQQQEDEKKKELQKLDEEIKKFANDAENDILLKREELLKPVSDRLQKAIDDVAKEGGYTYILNSTNSAGVSTILFGPEQDNITEKVMKKLNITVPVAPDKTKPNTNGGK